TGGLSYAVVLSQERLNHYTEYTDAPIYSSASDSNAPTNSPVNTVSTTVAASENNVNTNGFGGFVNFSIGRKTQLGKSVKLSVEPVLALPVGRLRRADSNYTSGGVKIITYVCPDGPIIINGLSGSNPCPLLSGPARLGLRPRRPNSLPGPR